MMQNKGVNSTSNFEWFPRVTTAHSGNGMKGLLVKTLIAVGIGLVFLMLGHLVFAVALWAISGLICWVSLASAKGRHGILRVFGLLGEYLGSAVAYATLAPVYLLGFTAAHIFSRLSGADPLHLRGQTEPTYWLPCDAPERKLRYLRTMFATEPLVGVKRRGIAFLALIAVLLVAAEIALRLFGLGTPVLYVNDLEVGYYPAPNKHMRRTGGEIRLNKWGMRAPDYSREKPAGTFRILMLGDSTLWGGSYVDQKDLYARRLEDKLNEVARARGSGPVEVLNMGVNGWGPINKRGFVEKFGTFDADLAIICLPYGDLYRTILAPLMLQPYFSVEHPPRLALEEVLAHVAWQYHSTRVKPAPDEERERQARKGSEAYLELAQILQRNGCEVIVEILPSRTSATAHSIQSPEKERVTELQRLLNAAGFQSGFDPTPFRVHGSPSELYQDEVHLAPAGHAIYADYLRDRIERHSSRFHQWASR